jgi:ABC-type multidrug transport system ATPase subunit
MHVVVNSLSKSYAWTKVLCGVSLQIDPGQIVVILGPNGAGKTTLLRCVAGLTIPNSGEIFFDGELFARRRIDLRRRLFFLPDFPSLFSSMDPVRQIALTLEAYENDLAGVEDKVVALLREFDLLAKEDALIGRLSRGQAYKVGLIGLLAVDPELWLLDEPLASGMDPHGIMAFKRHARAAASRGRTVIYTTQILEVAESFSDRVCIIDEGRIQAFERFDLLRVKATGRTGVLEELFLRLRETA